KRVEFLFAKVLNRKDLMIYDPFKEKYLIVEDAFDDKKSGKTQIFSKIYINTHSYLDMSESFEQMCYKGTLLTNAIYLRKNSLKVYNQFSNYICYDEFIDKTLFCKFNPNEKFSFYPLEELDSKENLFLIKDNSSIIYAEKGKVLPGSDYTFAYHNKDIVLYKNNQPTYCFPNCKNANSETIYPGRTYNSKTDSYTAEKSSSVSNSSTNYKDNSTTTETSCISGNCTDGFGVLKTSTSTITGFFAAGKANGYGKEVYDDGSGHYEGKFGSGVRSGFGLYYWNSTQQYYIGEWKHGKQHGYGYYKKGGEIFQAGYYENGKQVRNMLTQNFINKKAVGNCIGNCYDGFGFYQFPNNDKYVGFFKNGKKDYVGAYTWATGDAYIGGLLLGSLSGQAMLFYKSTGTTYYGNISNGIRQGMGAYFNKSGDIESKGFWDNGVLKRAL
ncbi:MAG: hypothetical protein KDD03_11445, partial [Gelidibacter sp.]|nr:hypothetical protein [Gelidibacter sp.]